jgi:hypothetical protein
MALNINIRGIAHRKQRYPTCGDWFGKKHLVVLVSKMANPDYMFLVALHEVVEAWLCIRRGIKERDVTRFDMEYEAMRDDGDVSEPGNSKAAPYYEEHRFASRIEKLMARELGVDWDDYEETINAL